MAAAAASAGGGGSSGSSGASQARGRFPGRPGGCRARGAGAGSRARVSLLAPRLLVWAAPGDGERAATDTTLGILLGLSRSWRRLQGLLGDSSSSSSGGEEEPAVQRRADPSIVSTAGHKITGFSCKFREGGMTSCLPLECQLHACKKISTLHLSVQYPCAFYDSRAV